MGLRRLSFPSALAVLAAATQAQTVQRGPAAPNELKDFSLTFEQAVFDFPEPVEARFWIEHPSGSTRSDDRVLLTVAPRSHYVLSYLHDRRNGGNRAAISLPVLSSDTVQLNEASRDGETQSLTSETRYVPEAEKIALDVEVEIFETTVELYPVIYPVGKAGANDKPQRREKTTDTFKIMARFWMPGAERSAAPVVPATAEDAEQMTAPVATFPADAAHADAGARCLASLVGVGIGARTAGDYFPTILVRPADLDRARTAIAHEIETSSLHVRLISKHWPVNTTQPVVYYPQDDVKTRDRLTAILHEMQLGGGGNAGTEWIDVPEDRAAEARHLLYEAKKREKLPIEIQPLTEESCSPGEVFFLTHQTIRPDQSPTRGEIHHLRVRQDVEVQPLTFTSKIVWDFTTEADAIAATWSPDAHFLLFTAARTGETKFYAVDLTKPAVKETEIALPASPLSLRLDLGKIAWPSADRALLSATPNSAEQWELDLSASPPRLAPLMTTTP